MKSTNLDTTSSSKVESSFFKDVEFKTLHSPQAVHQSTTWQTLQEAVQSTHPLAEVWVKGSEPLPERAKMLVLAAVALDLGDEMLLREVEKAEVLRDYVSDWRQTLDRDKVREEAVRVCVDYDLENVACHLVETSPKLPLYLIHRAGEKGQLRLLKAISDFKVEICPSRVIASVAHRFLRHLHKPRINIRFKCKNAYLLPEDVLRWAYVSGGETQVREVLDWGLSVPDEVLVQVLMSEGLVGLFEDLVAAGKLRLSAKFTKFILVAGQLPLLLRLVDVSST